MARPHPVQLAYNTHEPSIGEDRNLAPIIYLHGVTFCKEQWADIPQVVANATKRKTYVLDARNHGDSEWSDDWSFDVNTDDLIQFLDSHGICKSILVGHSMGGITAINVALKRPDLVERIVTEDIGVRKLTKEIFRSVYMYIYLCRRAINLVPADLEEDDVKKFIFKHVAFNFPKELVPLRNADIADLDENVGQGIALRPDKSGRYIYKANLEVIERGFCQPETVMSDVQGMYKGPALFIYGKLSPFLVGADEHNIKQFFPNAIFEGIEDASHTVHSDKPLEFTDTLIKYLS